MFHEGGDGLGLEPGRDCFDTKICTSQPSGTTVVCSGGIKRVTRYTDGAGSATFRLIGSSSATSGSSPGAGQRCANVYACGGVNLGSVTVAIYDLNGNGVNVSDLSIWQSDYYSGQYKGRSDYDGNGVIAPPDQSLFMSVSFGGGSASGCTQYSPPGTYCQ